MGGGINYSFISTENNHAESNMFIYLYKKNTNKKTHLRAINSLVHFVPTSPDKI